MAFVSRVPELSGNSCYAADTVIDAGDWAIVGAIRNAANVFTHHTADITETADGTGVVAIRYAAAAIAHHTAKKAGIAVDGAAVIAIRDNAAARAYHTAGRSLSNVSGVTLDYGGLGTDNSAGVGATFNATLGAIPHHTTDAVCSGDITAVMTVRDAAGVLPHHTTDIQVVTADRAGVIAVRDVALVIANYTTGIEVLC